MYIAFIIPRSWVKDDSRLSQPDDGCFLVCLMGKPHSPSSQAPSLTKWAPKVPTRQKSCLLGHINEEKGTCVAVLVLSNVYGF